MRRKNEPRISAAVFLVALRRLAHVDLFLALLHTSLQFLIVQRLWRHRVRLRKLLLRVAFFVVIWVLILDFVVHGFPSVVGQRNHWRDRRFGERYRSNFSGFHRCATHSSGNKTHKIAFSLYFRRLAKTPFSLSSRECSSSSLSSTVSPSSGKETKGGRLFSERHNRTFREGCRHTTHSRTTNKKNEQVYTFGGLSILVFNFVLPVRILDFLHPR